MQIRRRSVARYQLTYKNKEGEEAVLAMRTLTRKERSEALDNFISFDSDTNAMKLKLFAMGDWLLERAVEGWEPGTFQDEEGKDLPFSKQNLVSIDDDDMRGFIIADVRKRNNLFGAGEENDEAVQEGNASETP